MPAAPLLAVPVPPADLGARRARSQVAVAAAAAAPVQHLPAALLDALQGSWGTPQELLGEDLPLARLSLAR